MSDFLEAARVALDECIAAGRPFTAEEVRARIPANVRPEHHNQLPGVISRASRARRIQRVSDRTASRQTRHGGLLRVWVAGAAA